MKKAIAVIGSNYGDEGKGLMTDYFVNQFDADCMVVRFNGGAQAGHTVVTPEGQRHVFGHLGSGTFQGASTYLAEQFIVNPIIFKREFRKFQKEFGITPKVYVHPHCRVTTPYDMMINQITEEQRGDCKHGSCGMGINETIERSIQHSNIIVRDMQWIADGMYNLKFIRDGWMPERLLQNGINTSVLTPTLLSDSVIEKYLNDVQFFIDNTTVATYDILMERNLVFEGAQGLLLDQYHANFPHVTRSSTGIENIAAIAKKIGLEDVEVVYGTRWYLTRHGRGQMPNECSKEMVSALIEDKTNIFNIYQENLRFGLLDINYLCETIKHDLTKNDGVNFIPSLSVTCLDQAPAAGVCVYVNNVPQIIDNHYDFMHLIEDVFELENINFKDMFYSFSETREQITLL